MTFISYEIRGTVLRVLIDHRHSFFYMEIFPLTHGCSCVSVKWFRTAFLLLVFFQSVLWGWAFVPDPHLYVWWALPDPVTNVHAGLEPQQAIQLFPQSLDLSLWWYHRHFRGIVSKPHCWCQRTGAAEQKRLWLPLRPAVSTPKALVLLLYEPCVIFHTITFPQCAFAAMSLQITLHSRSHLNLSKERIVPCITFFLLTSAER